MVNVHDIIYIENFNQLVSYQDIPEWVPFSLKQTPYGVVRRQKQLNDLIPIGIRGDTREKRYACFIKKQDIQCFYTPFDIVKTKQWRQHQGNMYKSLELIDTIFKSKQLEWGLIGSLAYELITKNPVVHENSDIDLIVKYQTTLTLEVAQSLLHCLKHLPYQVDVQVEMKEGSFSLEEYANSNGEEPILIRTFVGPKLAKINTN